MIFVKLSLLSKTGITKETRNTSEKLPVKFDKALNRCLLIESTLQS